MGSAYTKPSDTPSVVFPSFRAGLTSLEGKVIAITGTTSGTGYLCAKTVGELGGEVVLLNRPSERQKNSLAKLREAVPSATFVPIDCDLSNFASVRAAIASVKEKYTDKGLDVLCNNAGIMANADEATSDGYDCQMQTNHLSHFLLTKELMPVLERAAALRGEARVVNHSSEMRKMPPTPLEAKYLQKNGGNLGGNGATAWFTGPRWERYHQTKLANVVFTLALHDRLSAANSAVKALVAHPGVAATDLQVKSVNDGGMNSWLTGYLMALGQSAEDGAMGLIKCVCVPGLQSGSFHGPKNMFGMAGPAEEIRPERICRSDDAKRILWEESMNAVRSSEDDDFIIQSQK